MPGLKVILLAAALAFVIHRAISAEDGAAAVHLPPWSMPTEDVFTADELQTQFEYRRTIPFGDPSLAVMLPCRATWNWVPISFPVKSDVDRMVPLARVEPPGEPGVAIEMKYVLLTREVKLEDWVDWFLVGQGLRAVGGQLGTYHGRHTVDAVAEARTGDGQELVARLGFFKNGNRIYLTVGSAPKEKYETYAAEFGLAVTAATPATLLPQAQAEPMKEHRLEVGVRLAFEYPGSWTARDLPRCPAGVVGVDLFHEEVVRPLGVIKVRTYRKERIEDLDAEKITWSIFEEIREGCPDLALEEPALRVEATHDVFAGGGMMTVYPVRIAGKPMEVHELILDRDDAAMAVVLVTPPRDSYPQVWMVNHRAWELVGITLRDLP